MKTVWLVEQGSYSDYHVIGVYSSRDNAQAITDAINKTESWNKAEVMEVTLDPGVKELREGLDMWMCNMLKDGTVDRCWSNGWSANDINGDVRFFNRSAGHILHVSTYAKDQNHAVKITNEKRLQILANKGWPK